MLAPFLGTVTHGGHRWLLWRAVPPPPGLPLGHTLDDVLSEAAAAASATGASEEEDDVDGGGTDALAALASACGWTDGGGAVIDRGAQLRKLMEALLRCLAAAHALDVVHRDIKAGGGGGGVP